MKKEYLALGHLGLPNLVQTHSVAQLQKIITNKHKNKVTSSDKIKLIDNLRELHVVSPFYDRQKVCKLKNCHCPYHKKIKQNIPTRFTVRPEAYLTCASSPNKQPTGRFSHKLLKINEKNQKLKRQLMLNPLRKSKIDAVKNQFYKLMGWSFQFNSNQLSQSFSLARSSIAKSSVGQIFQYIYQNMHLNRQEIKKYIQDTEKDRDITDFYLQRYDQLKTKWLQQPNIHRKQKPTKYYQNIKSDNKYTLGNNIKKDGNFENTRTRKTQFVDIPETTYGNMGRSRKQSRYKSKKLIMEIILKDLQEGQQIQENQLHKIGVLDQQIFEENIKFLKKKIKKLQVDTLNELKEEVLVKVQQSIQNQITQLQKKIRKTQIQPQIQSKQKQESDDSKKKIVQFSPFCQENKDQKQNENIDQIKQKIKSLQRKQTLMNSLFEKMNKKIEKQQQEQLQNESQQSHDNKISQKQQMLQEQSDYIRQQERLRRVKKQSQLQNNNQNNSNKNQSKPSRFAESKQQQMISQAKKTQRLLQQQKSRKRINTLHSRKRISISKTNPNSIKFINFPTTIDDLQQTKSTDIDDMKRMMNHFGHNFKNNIRKIRQIQILLQQTDVKVADLIVEQDDSLFTTKRKVRVFKKLLQQKYFDKKIENQVVEYLQLLTQQSYVKNRKWAESKLKNIINTNIQSNQYEQPTQNTNQIQNNFIRELIDSLEIGKKSLVYYNLDQIPLIVLQIDLSNYVFRSIDSQSAYFIRKSLARKKKPAKKTTLNQIINKPASRDGDLIQVGLPIEGMSHICYQQSINLLAQNKSMQAYREKQDRSYLTVLQLLKDLRIRFG